MIEDVTSAAPEVDEPTAAQAAQQTARDAYQDFTQHVRNHPMQSVLAVAAIGFVIGLAIKASKPEPTMRERFATMMEEFEERLKETASTASRKAGSLASDGASAVQSAACSAESGLRSVASEAMDRIRGLFR